MSAYQIIMDWSEVWALSVAVFFVLKNRNTQAHLKPIFYYLIIAFLLNLCALSLQYLNRSLPIDLKYKNGLLYNAHSLTRTILFVMFFKRMDIGFKWLKYQWVLVEIILVVMIIFLWFDDPFIISSKLFTFEGIVLLVYCISFFLQRIKDEEIHIEFDASLIIVTGLTIYESINFFIFLFFNTLMQTEMKFADSIWDVHNIAFMIFCVFLSYAFYGKVISLHK